MTDAREVAGKLTKALDRFLTSRTIPVECFGWETLGYTYPTVGHPVAYGRWHWPEDWREPFYQHNRRLSELAIRVRRVLMGLVTEKRNGCF